MSRYRHAFVESVRSLWRAPAFTVAAILTMALGMAAAVTMFAFVNGVLLSPLPYPHAERLVNVERWSPKGTAGGLDIASMDDFVGGARAAEVFAAYRSLGVIDIGGLDRPAAVTALEVTASFLDVLGSRTSMGRGFDRAQERGDSQVVILTHKGWTTLFARDPGVVGRILLVNGRPVTVVGVTAPDLELPRNSQAALLLPLDRTGQQVDYGRIAHRCVARLRAGMTPDDLRRDLERIERNLAREVPARRFPDGWSIRVTDLQQALLGDRRLVSLALLGAAVALLGMGCANVANLFLLRAARRRGETAIRAALGATTTDLAAQSLAEGTLIGLSGAALGTGIAAAAVRALPLVLSSFSNVNGVLRLHLDTATCAFAAVAGIATSVLFALASLLHARGSLSSRAVSQGGPRGSRSGNRYRAVLLVSQAAIAGLLLATALLFGRSLGHALLLDPGLDAQGVTVVRLFLPEKRYPTLAAISAIEGELRRRLDSVAGVQAVTAALFTPLEGDAMAVMCSGLPVTRPMAQWDHCVLDGVSDGYFSALRIPIIRGREVRRGEAGVAVINEALARRLFPGADAVGRTVRLPLGNAATGATHRDVLVVGVSRDCRNLGVVADVMPRVSLPFDQFADSGFSLLVRSRLPPDALRHAVEAQLRSLDAQLPIRSIVPLQEIAGDSVADLRQNAILLAVFTLLGLSVAVPGTYMVVAAAVSQRTREIGIRMALGAARMRVVGTVLTEGSAALLIGAFGGVAAAIGAARLLRHQLFGVTPTDPVSLCVTVVALTLLGGLASTGPARRATRVDPASTLREG
jgi:putative ABC transport system permease protein